MQNGYPSRRRSLVDDARFETIMVKQTKQSVLEEAREKANGKFSFRVFIFEVHISFSTFFFVHIYCVFARTFLDSAQV